MVVPDIRNMVMSTIKKHLGEDAKKPGAVLYNGWNTLCSSNGLYIMGFNPGGDPNNSKTIIDYLGNLEDNYCSYEDECWHSSCSPDCRIEKHFGERPHQKRVKELAQVLGYDVRQSFAANAVFFRTKSQDDLMTSWEVFKKCWPVHQEFLNLVRPKTILCLGNGERASAFVFLRRMLAPDEKSNTDRVKSFWADAIKCQIIGVRHPSRFDPVKDLRLYLQQNKCNA